MYDNLSPAEHIHQLFEQPRALSDDAILAELRALPVLPDEQDPAWENEATWYELADRFVALAAEVTFVLVPTEQWQEIPARLPNYPMISGVNAATHISMFHYWNNLHGAELVQLTRDGLTLRATQPPQKREQALVLAWEHTRYCSDISSLDILERAITLARGEAWTFWWD